MAPATPPPVPRAPPEAEPPAPVDPPLAAPPVAVPPPVAVLPPVAFAPPDARVSDPASVVVVVPPPPPHAPTNNAKESAVHEAMPIEPNTLFKTRSFRRTVERQRRVKIGHATKAWAYLDDRIGPHPSTCPATYVPIANSALKRQSVETSLASSPSKQDLHGVCHSALSTSKTLSLAG